jgi:hypothetical protein
MPKKAFDKLNHEILFNKLYHNGIKGDMWVLLRNMYREMTTQVKWDNHLSENIYVISVGWFSQDLSEYGGI